MSFGKIYDIAGTAINANSLRLNTISSNLANADAISGSEAGAYRSLKPVFSTIYNDPTLSVTERAASAGVTVQGIVQTDQPVQKRHEPDNPLADKEGYVYYSNVNVVEEMADMLSASRNYEANVEMLNQAKSMQQSLLRLGDRV
ncbi:flagellar basal body rod protein FlgC [Pluralibacter sp.]|jgi:flagellar basal-body rod protein FlgC|uniref:flagellar basal body rod protein FlgC n=1 Tax=Pluralibacter sp. TaxID=1920032 RepID=UPI0025EE8CC3|nr:flagellar basal body rod protein FlgC [Pluralibacter sp.]MBV8043974.1 flagellar basal body rod protein FlgC [Pluralibacter sp.]